MGRQGVARRIQPRKAAVNHDTTAAHGGTDSKEPETGKRREHHAASRQRVADGPGGVPRRTSRRYGGRQGKRFCTQRASENDGNGLASNSRQPERLTIAKISTTNTRTRTDNKTQQNARKRPCRPHKHKTEKRPMAAKCETCKHHCDVTSECRRNPPTVDGFPKVALSDWCAEHRPNLHPCQKCGSEHIVWTYTVPERGKSLWVFMCQSCGHTSRCTSQNQSKAAEEWNKQTE